MHRRSMTSGMDPSGLHFIEPGSRTGAVRSATHVFRFYLSFVGCQVLPTERSDHSPVLKSTVYGIICTKRSSL